jgi:hypothetical protein
MALAWVLASHNKEMNTGYAQYNRFIGVNRHELPLILLMPVLNNKMVLQFMAIQRQRHIPLPNYTACNRFSH